MSGLATVSGALSDISAQGFTDLSLELEGGSVLLRVHRSSRPEAHSQLCSARAPDADLASQMDLIHQRLLQLLSIHIGPPLFLI